MTKKTKKSARDRRKYSAEFKAEAVKLVQEQGLSRAQVARDLGVSSSMVARWVQAAEAQALPGALSPDEREELRRLRRENKVLRTECLHRLIVIAGIGST